MNDEPLKRVLESLNEIKASMHNVAETSAYEKLDEAIMQVQRCIENGDTNKDITIEVLHLVGKVLESLPSIATLMKFFSG